MDTTKGYDQGDEYPGTTYFAPKTINRVTIKTVGGKDFDPAATYTIATNDFMASAATPTTALSTPPPTTTWASPWTRWSWTTSPPC